MACWCVLVRIKVCFCVSACYNACQGYDGVYIGRSGVYASVVVEVHRDMVCKRWDVKTGSFSMR